MMMESSVFDFDLGMLESRNVLTAFSLTNLQVNTIKDKQEGN